MSARRTVGIVAASALLGAGLALVATSNADAHTGDLDVTAVCTDGVYVLTATLDIRQTGLTGETVWRVGSDRFEGTPVSVAGMDRGPVASDGAGTITLGTVTLPGDTTGLGPWFYAFTSWSDGYSKGSDGQLRSPLAGDCVVPEPEPTPGPTPDPTPEPTPDPEPTVTPEPVPTVTPAPTLPDTGAADGLFWLLGASVVVLGGLLVAIRSVASPRPRYKRGA